MVRSGRMLSYLYKTNFVFGHAVKNMSVMDNILQILKVIL
jgi:hypothetical protein